MARTSGRAGSGSREQGTGEKSPEAIQAEIEATREELGDTVAAMAEKADVKQQAKKKATRAKETAKEKLTGIADETTAKRAELKAKAQQATPESASEARDRAAQIVQENPVPAATAAAFLAGFVFGWIVARP